MPLKSGHKTDPETKHDAGGVNIGRRLLNESRPISILKSRNTQPKSVAEGVGLTHRHNEITSKTPLFQDWVWKK